MILPEFGKKIRAWLADFFIFRPERAEYEQNFDNDAITNPQAASVIIRPCLHGTAKHSAKFESVR